MYRLNGVFKSLFPMLLLLFNYFVNSRSKHWHNFFFKYYNLERTRNKIFEARNFCTSDAFVLSRSRLARIKATNAATKKILLSKLQHLYAR